MLNFWPSLIVLSVLQFTHILDFVVLMPLGPQLMREMSLGYFWLLIARAVMGAFGGVCASVVLAVVMTSFSLASILGIPVGLPMAQLYGWHIPFIVLGGLSIIISLVILLVIPSIKAHLLTEKTQSRHRQFILW